MSYLKGPRSAMGIRDAHADFYSFSGVGLPRDMP
jgi:hypothetical protein